MKIIFKDNSYTYSFLNKDDLDKNYVTLDSEQSIKGNKTFANMFLSSAPQEPTNLQIVPFQTISEKIASRELVYFYNICTSASELTQMQNLGKSAGTKIYNFADAKLYTYTNSAWTNTSFNKTNFGVPNFSIISSTLSGKIFYYSNGNVKEMTIYPHYL